MKPKSARGASTRQKILEAAVCLIQKQGVHGTSVDDVLNASGTGKSQFYHYFTSKDALIQEVVAELANRQPGLRLDAIPAPGPELSLGAVEAWLARFVTDHERGDYAHGCPLFNIAAEMASQHEGLRVQLAAIFASWEERLASALAGLMHQGVLRDSGDDRALASSVLAGIQGALLLSRASGTAAPLIVVVAQFRAQLRDLASPGRPAVRSTGTPITTAKRTVPVAKKAAPLSFCP